MLIHNHHNSTYSDAEKHPKEVICSILSLSHQSTFEEIRYAYDLQHAELLSIAPQDAIEASLLREKSQLLENAFKEYALSLSQNNTDAKPKVVPGSSKRRTYTTYSFHIPCIFALLARSADCAVNCVCSCCCGDSGGDPCQDGCFYNNYYCDCFRFADTVIAVVAIIAGAVWSLKRIIPWIFDSIGRTQQTMASNRLAKRKKKFTKQYMSEYYPRLCQLYNEWISLQNYDVDIKPFLEKMNAQRTAVDIDSNFAEMSALIDDDYQKLENQWQQFLTRRNDLITGENSVYYQYLCEDAPDLEKFYDMLRDTSAPWKKS